MKKIAVGLFWFVFYGFLVLLLFFHFNGYIAQGLPEFMGNSFLHSQIWFILHISFGLIVYLIGVFQFMPSIRIRNLNLHRNLGKIYILSSLICILSLYVILPDSSCEACKPSQYMVTSLWLVFVLLAYFFIRRRKIELHKRMMISSFICAAYFVSVRIVSQFGMGIFKKLFNTEQAQLLASDIFVWAAPLAVFHIYWMVRTSNKGFDEIYKT